MDHAQKPSWLHLVEAQQSNHFLKELMVEHQVGWHSKKAWHLYSKSQG